MEPRAGPRREGLSCGSRPRCGRARPILYLTGTPRTRPRSSATMAGPKVNQPGEPARCDLSQDRPTWAITRPRGTRRGSSTTGTAGSAGSPRASSPTALGARAGDIEIAPGRAQLLIAARVDEVRAEDLIALTDEGVVSVPLVDAEILVEVVGERIPRDEFPAHPLLQALDLGLGGAGDIHQRRVPRVQVRRVCDLVGPKGTADAGPLRVGAARLRVSGDVRRVEGAVDNQLPATPEQVRQARRSVRSLKAVLLSTAIHGIAGAQPTASHGRGSAFLLDEQRIARGLPLLRRDDWRGTSLRRALLRYSFHSVCVCVLKTHRVRKATPQFPFAPIGHYLLERKKDRAI